MSLKVGIVGMGGIGNLHADCYAAIAGAQLIGVCDVIAEKAEAAATKHGVKAYAGLAEMLANEELDFVDVTTSGYENGSWHFEPAMEALNAGKHVLCEKPLSNSIEECREMVRFASDRGLYLGCNLNHYFTTVADEARRMIADGRVGETLYALFKTGFNGGEFTYGGKGTARFNQPYAHMKAFLTHPFSVMRALCGEITHVQAFASRPGCRQSASDLLLSVNSVHFRFANGAVGYLLSQRGDAMWGLGGWWSCEVGGTHGTFCIENCTEKLTYWGSPTADSKHEPTVIDTKITDFNTTFGARIAAFVDDVARGVHPEHLRASGRDALATMEVIFAAIESVETGGALVRPRALPPLHGDPATERI
jgi:predicted dehydrogenase